MKKLPALLLTLVAAPALAAGNPCAGPEHHQFDFWLGDWAVTNPAGQPAGDNTLIAIAGGCALSEHWRGAKGSDGYSYSAYDGAKQAWHQTWVDNSGLVLQLDGGFRDGAMVLSGPTGATLNRVTWTPRKDGTVRQLWESSADQGKTWQVQFDGLYRKKP